jgi:hypothetical protein
MPKIWPKNIQGKKEATTTFTLNTLNAKKTYLPSSCDHRLD